jgi:CBS domain containing-hemolysin-like protein
MNWITDVLRLIAVVILVMMNGFFVAAEFSLVSIRRTRVAEMVAIGKPGAKWVQLAIENPDRVIAATQLGITLASLGLGWLGEPALSHLLEPVVRLFPPVAQQGISEALSAALAFTMITFLHVVAGELAPKSIALQNPEKTSLFVAQPTVWTERIFKPAIWALNGTGNLLLKAIGIKPATGHELAHSVDELKMLVTASAKGGVVEAEESEMLHAIFDMGELLVRQVMVPRTEIVAVEADSHLDDIIALANESNYTKFPVYEDNIDQILGIVHVKELLRAMQKNGGEDVSARSLAREAIYVPETLSVTNLLQRFRVQHQHIAVVLDEYGGTAGLITLEDLIEEIVGEVSDPFDVFTPEIQTLNDGSYLVNGLTLIEEVNEKLGLKLEDPNYYTIAGYLLGKLGRIPKVKDAFEGSGVRMQVEAMDGMRISRLSINRPPNPAPVPKES